MDQKCRRSRLAWKRQRTVAPPSQIVLRKGRGGNRKPKRDARHPCERGVCTGSIRKTACSATHTPRQVERQLRGVHPLPPRQGEIQVRGVHPLPPRQAETRLQVMHPLPSRQAEKQLRGVHPLPSRQAETRLRGVHPLPSRQVETQLRGVQTTARCATGARTVSERTGARSANRSRIQRESRESRVFDCTVVFFRLAIVSKNPRHDSFPHSLTSSLTHPRGSSLGLLPLLTRTRLHDLDGDVAPCCD